ncbi:phytoene desaturase family protein [Yoonia litorea]|uniref:Phytoene dehydrogenase-related protein n=1 Tax=Yoonia litorea TaxID=1123755 RepID=A0A1I6ME35_9RHOB|nr:NAD(P)/FAD-dependent oxidoreductase [Yoonia litorea]SFS13979.1 Phytoene dehydrogenase-related protein [Yoonia litorea]
MQTLSNFDVVVLGGGISGVSAACRLQTLGFSTAVLEVHDKPGGCAGYYTRDGFSFDIGATTLVDFSGSGVGAKFLDDIGLTKLSLEHLPGYQAWLPDQTVTLHRKRSLWRAEREAAFGNSPQMQKFWKTLDSLADIFWAACQKGITLPINDMSGVLRAARSLPAIDWPKARYLSHSLGDLVDRCGVRENRRLIALLSMLCEDTLHSRTIDDAPLISAALGTSIRGRISRPRGGMQGFWRAITDHYEMLGGTFVFKTKVVGVEGECGDFTILTKRGRYKARTIVNTIPAPSFAELAPSLDSKKFNAVLRRNAGEYGSGVVICLGVPETEVDIHEHRHHQILERYDAPLGNGNNMFISVSAANDLMSAPEGFRSVMISTHTDIDSWDGLCHAEYKIVKQEITDHLLRLARRVYPNLGNQARILEVGTPKSYARFARRPLGAVGGVRTTMRNANQNAMQTRVRDGVFLAGEYVWPGLGSVACLMSGSNAANEAKRDLRKKAAC